MIPVPAEVARNTRNATVPMSKREFSSMDFGSAPKRGGFFWLEQKPGSVYRVCTISEDGNYILRA